MSERAHKKQQWQCKYSQLPEFIVELPEKVHAEAIEVQKMLLLAVRGVLHKLDKYHKREVYLLSMVLQWQYHLMTTRVRMIQWKQ